MSRTLGLLYLVMVSLFATVAFGQESPSFQDYSVPEIYKGEIKAPGFGPMDQYSGTDLRCFGDDPARYAAMHVNFAGHFVIRACSCGSGCRYLFLWDARTGKVYRDASLKAFNVGSPSQFAGEQHRADSSLLVLDGCFEGTSDCAKRYYVWRSERLRLVRTVPSRKPLARR